MALVGAAVVILTAITVFVQYREADYSQRLTEWEDCRITAITKSTVTDDLVGSIVDANQHIYDAQTFEASKGPRRALDAQLRRIQGKRQQALADQAACGNRPQAG